ncbi:MAG: hypothetical protein J5793_02105, partial [Clostridia bacterium]|nr:hypothetical protein [Clostridia bacterium]
PVGFSLYIDKPDWYNPLGCDITDFIKHGYNEMTKGIITLPILSVDTLVPFIFNKPEQPGNAEETAR